jgi:hypothetical protein
MFQALHPVAELAMSVARRAAAGPPLANILRDPRPPSPSLGAVGCREEAHLLRPAADGSSVRYRWYWERINPNFGFLGVGLSQVDPLNGLASLKRKAPCLFALSRSYS